MAELIPYIPVLAALVFGLVMLGIIIAMIVVRPPLEAVLAITITVAVICMFAVVMFKPPDGNNQIITGMVSTIMTVFVMVFTFYFGSSKGSKDKDESKERTLDTMTNIAARGTGTGVGNTIASAVPAPPVAPVAPAPPAPAPPVAPIAPGPAPPAGP